MAICMSCDNDIAISVHGRCPACEMDAYGYIDTDAMLVPVTFAVGEWDVIVQVLLESSNPLLVQVGHRINSQVEAAQDRVLG